MRFGSLFMAAAVGTVLALTVPALAQERYAPGNAQPYHSETWVRVGYDYNNDGYVDRWDWVMAGDIDRARHAGMRPGQTGYSTVSEPEKTVSGSIRDLKMVDLAGLDEDHWIGKVHMSDGRTAHVDFGPVATVDRLSLRKGQRVVVHGRTGTINNRPVLMAQRIEADGQTLMVNMPHDRQMAPYSGQILSVRTASFGNRDLPEQVFARVRLDGGATTAVNLGPRNQLGKMDFKDLEGKRVSFLAHPAHIDGERALVADELRVDGRMISIDWSA